jgi:flagellar M-ring protein FliF
MVSSQKTEDTSTSPQLAGGLPGTASNLPDAAPRPSGSGGGTSRRTESVSYQTSRTVKRTVLPQGSVKRLSISVLLDHELRFEGSGANTKKVLTPPTPERLKVIHDLAAAAVGLDANRGDQLIVESLPFESTLNLEPPGAAPPPATAAPTGLEAVKNDPKVLGGVAAAAVALIAGVVFLILKMRKGRSVEVEVEQTAALPAASPEANATPALEGAEAWRPSTLASSGVPALAAARAGVLADQVRETALKDVEICAGVLRGWLREES